jgi:hypothetical protein
MAELSRRAAVASPRIVPVDAAAPHCEGGT